MAKEKSLVLLKVEFYPLLTLFKFFLDYILFSYFSNVYFYS